MAARARRTAAGSGRFAAPRRGCVEIPSDDRAAPIHVHPFVEHTLEDDGTFLLEADPVMSVTNHRWDVAIAPESLPLSARRDDDDEDTDAWDRLVARFQLSGCQELATESRIVLAYMESDEYPVAMCEAAAGGDWREWFDDNDDDETGLFDFVATLARDEGGAAPWLSSPLSGGSVHYLRVLGVHPLLRGRGLGSALLTHVLWTLRRSDGDLAIIEALPTRSQFDDAIPERSAATVRQLVRRYQRLGFHRVHPRRTITARAEPMYFQFGAYRIPGID